MDKVDRETNAEQTAVSYQVVEIITTRLAYWAVDNGSILQAGRAGI